MPVIPISDLSDPRLEDYSHLTDVALKKARGTEHGLYLAESALVLERARGAGHQPRSVLALGGTVEEAVALANDTEYGLVSYAFTADLDRGQRLVDRLETGMMGLNVGVISNAAAPFGGVKQSGVGREGGVEGIHEYLSTKYTLTPDPYR